MDRVENKTDLVEKKTRKNWAAGAQLAVKSGRTERERRAISAQSIGKVGENGLENKKQQSRSRGSSVLAGHSNQLNQTN